MKKNLPGIRLFDAGNAVPEILQPMGIRWSMKW